MPEFDNMHYVNVLGHFKTYHDAYFLLKKQTSFEVTLVCYKYKEKKIIKWVPLFDDALSLTLGRKDPLVYIVRKNSDVPNVGDDPLTEMHIMVHQDSCWKN